MMIRFRVFHHRHLFSYFSHTKQQTNKPGFIGMEAPARALRNAITLNARVNNRVQI